MPRPAKEPNLSDAARLTFKVDELEAPKPLDVPLSEGYLSGLLAEAHTPFHCQGPGKLQGELTGVDGGALLRANLTTVIVSECRRCLVPVTDTLNVPMVVKYVSKRDLASRKPRPERGQEREEPGVQSDRDLDEEPFDGQRVDLATAVREQLILALPMGELCEEGCKGLCAVCGQNLNERVCDCRPETTDLRWHRLKELKLGN